MFSEDKNPVSAIKNEKASLFKKEQLTGLTTLLLAVATTLIFSYIPENHQKNSPQNPAPLEDLILNNDSELVLSLNPISGNDALEFKPRRVGRPTDRTGGSGTR